MSAYVSRFPDELDLIVYRFRFWVYLVISLWILYLPILRFWNLHRICGLPPPHPTPIVGNAHICYTLASTADADLCWWTCDVGHAFRVVPVVRGTCGDETN